MYAAARFGEVKEVLLATFDGKSLRRCLRMGLVCFDGTILPLHNATSTMRDTALYARYRNATVFTNYMQVHAGGIAEGSLRLWHIVLIAVSAPIN